LKKKIIQYTGSLVAVLSVFYVLWALKKINWGSVVSSSNLLWIPIVIALIAVYMMINYIRAVNWTRIIDYLGNNAKHNRLLVIIYLKTEVAKYIPSNMIHLAGRHILARGLGYKDTVLMGANILDMALLLFVALLIVLAGFFSEVIVIPDLVLKSISNKSYMAVVAIMLAVTVIVFGWLLKSRKNKVMEFIKVNKIFDLIVIVILFVPGFILSTFILIVIYKFMLGVQVGVTDYLYFFTAFTMAWTAGFVIPGSPGGIGIRETVILILFGGIYGENNTVIAAILMRLISIAGDAGVWIFSCYCEKYTSRDSDAQQS